MTCCGILEPIQWCTRNEVHIAGTVCSGRCGILVENTGVCGPYCWAKGSVGNDVVQRWWECVNWIIGGEYRSVWTGLWGEV
jgi:hypothetical protein